MKIAVSFAFTACKRVSISLHILTDYTMTVKPWKDLLRKLRTCLLISLRLHGISLSSFPITVSNIEDGDIFSVSQLIAHDELSLTHKSQEIAELEEACMDSPLAFIPSLVEGDVSSNWKMLQISCIERHTFKNLCPDDESSPGPLLFFLQHYHDTLKLASHRSLILAQTWGREVRFYVSFHRFNSGHCTTNTHALL